MVLVEFHNCSPFVYVMESNKKITMDRVVKYFEDTEGWSEDQDSITFIDSPIPVSF